MWSRDHQHKRSKACQKTPMGNTGDAAKASKRGQESFWWCVTAKHGLLWFLTAGQPSHEPWHDREFKSHFSPWAWHARISFSQWLFLEWIHKKHLHCWLKSGRWSLGIIYKHHPWPLWPRSTPPTLGHEFLLLGPPRNNIISANQTTFRPHGITDQMYLTLIAPKTQFKQPSQSILASHPHL